MGNRCWSEESSESLVFRKSANALHSCSEYECTARPSLPRILVTWEASGESSTVSREQVEVCSVLQLSPTYGHTFMGDLLLQSLRRGGLVFGKHCPRRSDLLLIVSHRELPRSCWGIHYQLLVCVEGVGFTAPPPVNIYFLCQNFCLHVSHTNRNGAPHVSQLS